jgi:hypothetical protein
MKRGLTSAAIHALEDLESSRVINGLLRGSIFNPNLNGPNHHENWQSFGEMEWYLTCRQISHAADILNTYCQSVLADIIEVDENVWDVVRPMLPKKSRERDVAVDLLRKQDARDMKSIRELFRDELKVFWNPQIDLIVTLRNKIVHQDGFDPEAEVVAEIARCAESKTLIPPVEFLNDEIPIGIDDRCRLVIDARAGLWASSHTSNNIHMMDQNISYRFKVATRRWVPRGRSFSFGAQPPGNFFPGIPLPVASPEIPKSKPAPRLPPFHHYNYETMANPKEVECAQTWHRVRSEIDQFVRDYCAELDVEIRGLNPSVAGSILSHTIQGHDHHLGYSLARLGEDRKLIELGIRLRQRNFEPFITVWSDKTQMMDFDECALTEAVKEEIRKGVDRVVSG